MTEVINIASATPRFGDWGPGYLSKGPEAAFGVVRLRPGDQFDNHLHRQHEESFVVIEGELELWLDRGERLTLRVGDLVRCPAGREHYLRNVSAAAARALFVKAPFQDGDKVDLPWTPPKTGHSPDDKKAG